MEYINQGEKTRKEFLQEAKLYGYEIFTADVVKAFQTDFIAKSKSGELDDEERLEKAVELNDLKRQIVVNDDLTKSLLFYREPLVEWFDKAQRTGRYADNPTNRRLHRVDQPYKKREGHGDGEEEEKPTAGVLEAKERQEYAERYGTAKKREISPSEERHKKNAKYWATPEGQAQLKKEYKEAFGKEYGEEEEKKNKVKFSEKEQSKIYSILNNSEDVDDFISTVSKKFGLSSKELENSSFYKKYSNGDNWRGERASTIMDAFLTQVQHDGVDPSRVKVITMNHPQSHKEVEGIELLGKKFPLRDKRGIPTKYEIDDDFAEKLVSKLSPKTNEAYPGKEGNKVFYKDRMKGDYLLKLSPRDDNMIEFKLFSHGDHVFSSAPIKMDR